MPTIPWILISVVILIILLAMLAVWIFRNQRKKHEPDYYTFFTMGLVWSIFGLIFREEMFPFFVMGLVFLILGLANKDKWKSNHRRWEDLNSRERKIMKWMMIILGVFALLGLAVFYLL